LFWGVLCLQISTVWAQLPGAGRVMDLKGQVQSKKAQAPAWTDASVGQLLEPGEAVQTGSDGWAAVLLADETLIQINRNTMFIMKDVAMRAGWLQQKGILPASATSDKSNYELESGEIWLRNKNKGALIDIRTPSVTAGVRGTELNLQVRPDKTTVLTVIEGMVGVWNDFGSERAGPSEQVITRPGEPPRKQVLLSPEDAVQWTLFVPHRAGPKDMPLRSGDREFLKGEKARLEGLLAAQPGDAEPMIRIGEVERDLGFPDAAAVWFERALASQPGNSEALTGLGWTWLDRRQPRQALAAFFQAGSPLAATYLGSSLALEQLQAPSRAREMAEKGLAHYPDSPALRIQQASLDLSSREPARARVTLEDVTKAHPDAALAWSQLSIVYLTLNEKDAALEAARNGARAAPESPDAQLVKAYAHQAAFDLESALEATRKAAHLDERSTLAWVNLARLLFGMDQTEEAWKAIERAEALDPDDAEVQNLKGFLLLAQRRVDSAIRAFRKSIEVRPSLGEPHLGLALAFMRQGDTAAASEEMSTAILLEPQRSLFLSYWAKMLYQLRRFDQALDVLDMAARLDPRDPTPELYRGFILRDLNRPTEAISALNNAIALNDHLAVYRSRFLLDRDLAVKSVDLSILYNQLGLSEWATNKALASVKRDFTNYAGHTFYAGGLFREEGLGRVADGEALLGRLLSPANANSFNNFNNYTTFFEKPSIHGTLSGSVGSFDTATAEGVVFGAVPQINTAFSAIGDHAQTDGWQEHNSGRSTGAGGIIKWDPTTRDGIMLAGSTLQSEAVDQSLRPFEYSRESDPSDFFRSDHYRIELGYHHHFAPHNELLLYFTRFYSDGTSRSHDLDLIDRVLNRDRIEFKQPFTLGQAQVHFNIRDHQLFMGSLYYWGENDVYQNSLFVADTDRDGTINVFQRVHDARFLDNSFYTYYVKDIWPITSTLVLEAAAYVDRMVQTTTTSEVPTDFLEFNPRLGLVWNPAPAHTFRLAAFRYLLPFNAPRMDPLEIAGIPIYRNSSNGAIAREVDFKYEFEWRKGLFSINPFYIDREFRFNQPILDRFETDPGPPPIFVILQAGEDRITQKSHTWGVQSRLNQMLWAGLGFSADFRYLNVTDPNTRDLDNFRKLELEREELRVIGALRYVHPSGLNAGLAQTYRYIDRKVSDREDQSIWITDASIGYELPRKLGAINLAVQNIFDEHFDWVTDLFVFNGRIPRREILFSVSLNF
jgi:tetratricopeptide (TPR) repeat protein